MRGSLQWEGLEELYDALRRLPAELTAEAIGIVNDAADTAVAKMDAEYPEGELRDKLFRSTRAAGPFGVNVEIRNRSGWAYVWDHGTQLRRTTTKPSRKGHSTGAEWGRSRPKHTFGRNMAQQRRRMRDRLRGVVERAGFEVSGDDD